MVERQGRLTGIGDEGGASIEEQISNHKALGWDTIELRSIEGKNICEMDDKAFDAVYARIEEAKIRTIGFGSSIANWARPINTPFSRDLDDLRCAIPRMRRLGTSFIRIMSYPNDGRDEELWKVEVFRRMSELVAIANGEGIVLVLENCDGWASESPRQLSELLSHFNTKSLQVVFDPGNPIGHGATVEDTWAFYRAALPYIVHFHIKDCRRLPDGSIQHVMPGDGDCDVVKIMRDLVKTGYSGMFSIEPHLSVSAHLGSISFKGNNLKENYLEYGLRAKQILHEIGA
ncbi:MAG TPA: sugar phosphate isomerase/epimerase family protein [Rectinemataceae bacterium]|nr:sugar phosphate isomerase/epimerase family protein [Rectinemataceae bacterium]